MKTIHPMLFLFILFLQGTYLTGQPLQQADDNFWITNGEVQTIVDNEDILYIGGRFNYVGPPTGAGVIYDFESDNLLDGTAEVENDIHVVIADGNGGWYIGGKFGRVDETEISRIAHVNSFGGLDLNFDFPIIGTINTLDLLGDTLIIGGIFSEVQGQSRQNIAGIDLMTEELLAWDPEVIGPVYSITHDSEMLLVGGNIASVDGVEKYNLASFKRNDLSNTDWSPLVGDPSIGEKILTLLIREEQLFIGGDFQNVDGQPRSNFAAYAIASEQLLPIAPQFDNWVYELETYNQMLFVGGWFRNVNGQPKNFLCAIDIQDFQLSVWNPEIIGKGIGSGVFAMDMVGEELFIAGFFEKVMGEERLNLASLTMPAGELTDFDLTTGYTVLSLAADEERLFIGGRFKSAGGVQRRNLAAIDKNSGKATEFRVDIGSDINLSVVVNKMGLWNNQLIIGGRFTKIDTTIRYGLAALELSTETVDAWDPNLFFTSVAPPIVTEVAVAGDELFIGGFFSSVGNSVRFNLASFDLVEKSLTDWNPSTEETVGAIAVSDQRVFIGGQFSKINGQPRESIALVDRTNGDLDPWMPEIGIDPFPFGSCQGALIPFVSISDLIIDNSRLFIGGEFDTINGQIRNNLALVDLNSLDLENVQLNLDGGVRSVFADNNHLYVGGCFQGNSDQDRSRIAVFDLSSYTLTPWSTVEVQGKVNDVIASGGHVFAGGDFTRVGERISCGFTAFNDILTGTENPFETQTALKADVFPNPNDGHFEIRISNPQNRLLTMSIINHLGQHIYQTALPLKKEISTSFNQIDLTPGIYFIQVSNQNQRSFRKIIVQ